MNQMTKSKLETNEELAWRILQAVVHQGITEFCFCPGSRNVPLLRVLEQNPQIKMHFNFEERSAAFFALGRSKRTQRPIAVVTTSGTAAGELLPAAMEAYYTGVPLLLITADRPRHYRGSGAPQSAEQVGLFGIYASSQWDIAQEEHFDLSTWKQDGPAHLNICLTDPVRQWSGQTPLSIPKSPQIKSHSFSITEIGDQLHLGAYSSQLDAFLETSRCPFVLVGTLPQEACEPVVQFLIKLNAPVFLEGVSGLREDPRLQHLRITRTDKIWEHAEKADYPIDAILKIGGVPTLRLWRDLEGKQGEVNVCSISEQSFSGISWMKVIRTNLHSFFSDYSLSKKINVKPALKWLIADRKYLHYLYELFDQEPQAEASLIHKLSKAIPSRSHIYLGNSLPIREWNQAACSENKGFIVHANRGLNGIDGQISTFLGMCLPAEENWAILGDLTTLYDMAGLWMKSQLSDIRMHLIVVNNGGGKIFSQMYAGHTALLNQHQLHFGPLAQFWGIHYERWTEIPANPSSSSQDSRLIEIIPDDAATGRFIKQLSSL